MKDKLERFIGTIKDFASLSDSAKSDYFAYFLQVIGRWSYFTGTDINKCFDSLDLHKFARIGAYLSENSKKRGTKKPKFIKQKRGYTIERFFLEKLSKSVGHSAGKIKTSSSLRDLPGKLSKSAEKDFLTEAINCWEAGANRAAIIMVWILTLDHLFAYILKHKLSDFNKVLALNKDKRVKITKVASRDDFTDMPESKFIQFCRDANIISNDVRKILDQKLGTRNSAAHPSGIKIKPSKVEEFTEDLIENVILKYKL